MLAAMFAVGDYVKFARDGAVGLVITIREDRCQVMWEDHFVSWEKVELLQKVEADAKG
ncbi:hypothetical protein LOK74_13915 [Brevibacillus humidisoli]|uniref:hypothetical protein n=1 Tax=Brevibacillus humidisoli TaxID=2895522 RepID=UPI001E3004CA|nr:hypothetical protein [Brevibacillus humidisoli]UFJ39165.1 hypothetical protein LOK74_13915 [Brevibacillus humidisoli]